MATQGSGSCCCFGCGCVREMDAGVVESCGKNIREIEERFF
jgi:hypothetical protein